MRSPSTSSVRSLRGFADWPAIRATLHDGSAGAVGEDKRHLQDDLHLVADPVGGNAVERFGAVARLEQERFALRDPAQLGGEVAGFTREDQRRQLGQVLAHPSRVLRVGPLDGLGGRKARHESFDHPTACIARRAFLSGFHPGRRGKEFASIRIRAIATDGESAPSPTNAAAFAAGRRHRYSPAMAPGGNAGSVDHALVDPERLARWMDTQQLPGIW